MLPENPLISVIVPVYKAESFLDRCVESLCAQSYPNLEIILVDDGSPDNCPQLCDAWAVRDPRIKVLHKPNGGQAEARNQGVLASGGDYICFVDADDYVSQDYAAYLLSLLKETGADIACCSFRTVYDGSERFENQPPEKLEILDKVQACLALLGEHYMPFVTPWAKLLPRDLVLANPFPVGHLHEDEAIAHKLFYQAGSTAVGTRENYAYFQNSGSVTHNRKRSNMEMTLQAFEARYAYFEEQGCYPLQLAAARLLLSDLVYMAAEGDEPCREFLKSGRADKYLLPELDKKIKLRYRCYRLFGLDPTLLLHRKAGK